jgi:hypothetical protein
MVGAAVRSSAMAARHFSQCVGESINPREARHSWWRAVHTNEHAHVPHVNDISVYDMNPCLL